MLVTREHLDHFAVDAVRDALQARPELPLGPPAVTQALADTAAERPGLVTTVYGGETMDVTGFSVQVVGSNQAPIRDGRTASDRNASLGVFGSAGWKRPADLLPKVHAVSKHEPRVVVRW